MPEETSADGTGGREALSDERLAEVRRRHAAYAKSHAHMGAFACCSAHASADTVPELLAEVERLCEAEQLVEAQLAETSSDGAQWQRRAQRGDAVAKILRADLDAATARAETAERALAEMRERIVLALERTSNLHDQDAERYADERSPLLRAQAEALWDAAQMIRDGKEGET